MPSAAKIDFVKGDICDAALVDSLVARTDIVVTFAAESHNDNSLRNPWPFVHNQCRRHIYAARGRPPARQAIPPHLHRRVFSDLALDDTRKFDETTPYNPSSPYSATKAGSDHLVRAWSRSFSVQATITNCANNYGPYQHVEKMIPRQITNVLIGRMPRLYGMGLNVREWTHVHDTMPPFTSCLKRDVSERRT